MLIRWVLPNILAAAASAFTAAIPVSPTVAPVIPASPAAERSAFWVSVAGGLVAVVLALVGWWRNHTKQSAFNSVDTRRYLQRRVEVLEEEAREGRRAQYRLAERCHAAETVAVLLKHEVNDLLEERGRPRRYEIEIVPPTLPYCDPGPHCPGSGHPPRPAPRPPLRPPGELGEFGEPEDSGFPL